MKTTESTEVNYVEIIEDLKSSESKTRLLAIRNLPSLATALGKERTRNELIPFISELLEEEEEDNLIEIAKILRGFIDLVGGKSYSFKIFKIYELLLFIDEPQLKIETIISIKHLLSQLNINEIEIYILDLNLKLFNSETLSHKIALIDILPSFFQSLSSNGKISTIGYIEKLSVDENFEIKKHFYTNLKNLVGCIDEELLLKLMNQLIKEKNENIRISLIETLISFKNLKISNKLQDSISTWLQTLSIDESWRIKYLLSDKLNEIASITSNNIKIKQLIIDIFLKLLEEKDQEIRTCCCNSLDLFSEKMSKEENFEKVLVTLKKLSEDPISHVKASLAKNLLKICPLIGRVKTNEYLFPLFLTLLKDENHEIRVCLLKSIDKLNEVIQFEEYSQVIFLSMKEIVINKNWRIRLQVTECLPIIAKILSKENFIIHLLPISLSWLTDNVFAIREFSSKVIKNLYNSFRSEEIEKKITEKLNEMKNAINYLIRNSLLSLIKEFYEDDSCGEFNEKSLFPLVVKLSRDKVSNVRRHTVWLIKKSLSFLKSRENLNEAKALIDELRKDPDFDVSNLVVENDP